MREKKQYKVWVRISVEEYDPNEDEFTELHESEPISAEPATESKKLAVQDFNDLLKYLAGADPRDRIKASDLVSVYDLKRALKRRARKRKSK